MNKTVLTIGILTGIGYLMKDRMAPFLTKVRIGFLRIKGFHLDGERPTVRPVIWVQNNNQKLVVLKRLSGKVVYPSINAVFRYNLGDLLLEPDQKVEAAFSIAFENEDPFTVLADQLQRKISVPVEGTVEVGLMEKSDRNTFFIFIKSMKLTIEHALVTIPKPGGRSHVKSRDYDTNDIIDLMLEYDQEDVDEVAEFSKHVPPTKAVTDS